MKKNTYEQNEEYLETCFNEEAEKRENMLLELFAAQDAYWNN